MKSSPNPFTPDQRALAKFASAMAHPARISIVSLLRHCEESSCGRIVEALPLAQATVSQHLKILTHADLLITRKEGHKVFYRLDCDQIRSFCHAFQCSLGTQPQEMNS